MYTTFTQGYLPPESFHSLLSRPWGQAGCQKKLKTSRNSNFLVWDTVFQSELKNLQKRPKFNRKLSFWGGCLKFDQFGLKNSGTNLKIRVPWRFPLLLTPCLTLGLQKYNRYHSFYTLIWNLTTVAPSTIFFLFFKIRPKVSFIDLKVIKGDFLLFLSQNYMSLRLLQPMTALIWNDSGGKSASVYSVKDT